MKNYDKTGNQPGRPGFRTPAKFRANQDLKINQWKNQNAGKNRPMKIFNRGK